MSVARAVSIDDYKLSTGLDVLDVHLRARL